MRLLGNYRGETPYLGVYACVPTHTPPSTDTFTGDPKEPTVVESKVMYNHCLWDEVNEEVNLKLSDLVEAYG